MNRRAFTLLEIMALVFLTALLFSLTLEVFLLMTGKNNRPELDNALILDVLRRDLVLASNSKSNWSGAVFKIDQNKWVAWNTVKNKIVRTVGEYDAFSKKWKKAYKSIAGEGLELTLEAIEEESEMRYVKIIASDNTRLCNISKWRIRNRRVGGVDEGRT